jgi:hypothetical protein
MLRRTFGPERDKMIGHWRKFHKEELPKLSYLPNGIRMIK